MSRIYVVQRIDRVYMGEALLITTEILQKL